jgi:RNA polymerase sigma-70 factor (ECF subfamily)
LSERVGEETGPEAAFGAIVRAEADAVFGFVLRRVGDRALAEDLSQETFLRAWRGYPSFRGEASVRGWLLAIATNTLRDHARRARRRPAEVADAEAPDVPAPAEDPAARFEGAEDVRRVGAALASLSELHREMFLLRERDGLSYKEIARALECPIGTVMSGLARARERLLEAVRE